MPQDSPKPKRQNSSVSTTSSGGRTIRAHSRRRSSASNHPSPALSTSGLFAKLTGRGRSDHFSSDSDSTTQNDPLGAQDENHEVGDGANGDNGNADAGPSDYWRRESRPLSRSFSPSPPPNEWRMRSTEVWNDDPEEGNYDEWRPNDPLNTGPSTPPYKARNDHAQETSKIRNGPLRDTEIESIGTPDVVDQGAYQQRMRDVFADSPSSPRSIRSIDNISIGSPTPSVIKGMGGGKINGNRKQMGAYETAYRDVLEEKVTGGIGEEEFGTFESAQRDGDSDFTPSSAAPSISGSGRPAPSPLKRNITPYLHPSVSRLRSHLRTVSTSTQDSLGSLNGRPPQTRIPSHFSQISLTRSASASTLSVVPGAAPVAAPLNDQSPAFTFHPLRSLSAHLFSKRPTGRSSPARPIPSKKPSAVGVPALIYDGEETSALGKPTVFDVRGMIAVGTTGGYVVVYSFAQEIKHVLGTEAIAKSSGSVTAVTISSDLTYIAVGHASGNIYLYDLSSPAKPARTTLALTLKQVFSGRKEGHLQGSRILHIGFVGARHTSIVSGDEHGRAFWWSLGKVVGVESNDVVRMLGSYPEPGSQAIQADPSSVPSYPSKRPTTLFAADPLPLGKTSHSTDMFHFTALLTPVKLVIVGMKPKAKTWFRKMRNDVGGSQGGLTGCIAWLTNGDDDSGSDPTLAYSWGDHVKILRIRTTITSPIEPNGKEETMPEFVEGLRYNAPNTILALQWYDSNHLTIVTDSEIVLLDLRAGQAVENTPLQTRLLTSNDFHVGLGARSGASIPETISSSIRVHRAKLFLLTRSNVQVGSLLHWNDRILARVHAGDFLDAIQVALSYYESRAQGNYIGLPDTIAERQAVVGSRVRELMRASLEWAFSEERMRDDTHYTPDGRGVDLTSLFEGLANICIEACLSMGDTQFLFDDAFEAYLNVGIQGIFLALLEPCIFDGRIREVPPTITKSLIAMHEDKGELDLAEGVIWHVDPIALDINQAVTLCEEHALWDALIHVYTRAMRDFTAPLVKLIAIVASLDANRRSRLDHSDELDPRQEESAIDAYKLFAYMEAILSGVSYPSREDLPAHEADLARAEVYGFIFSDRLVLWPEGSDGQLVLPNIGDAAYPYLELLMRFDMEAFLHSMDIAFEDPYLNDAKAVTSRQTIINMMLDRMDPAIFHTSDITLLHIFVSRNLPKYPQFLFIPPSTLQHILVSLAQDPDQSTREDRQLAAEYLLSAYTPSDSDGMLQLFEQAGFWRILQSAYRGEKQWDKLIWAYVDDPDIDLEVFERIDGIVRSTKTKSGVLKEVTAGVEKVIPQLLNFSVQQTALLLDSHLPDLHSNALEALKDSDHKRMAYLRCLLQPTSDEDDKGLRLSHPSKHLDVEARHAYVTLLAADDSSALIPFLDQAGPDSFDLKRLQEEFQTKRHFEAQLWAMDTSGQTASAIDTAREIVRDQGTDLASALIDGSQGDLHVALLHLDQVIKMSVRICKARSTDSEDGKADADVEDYWYGILHEVLEVDHEISSVLQMSPKTAEQGKEVEERLKGLVTDTLSALVSSSSPHLSFPRLFKRLVDTSAKEEGKKGRSKKNRHYAQFRSILGGMLESYRAESDMLTMTTRLVQDDLFIAYKELAERKQSGWRGTPRGCAGCGEEVIGDREGREMEKAKRGLKVEGNGMVWHIGCERSEDELNNEVVAK